MLVVMVCGIPRRLPGFKRVTNIKLDDLRTTIKKAAVVVKNSGLCETEVSVFFQAEETEWGITKTEGIVALLFDKPQRAPGIRDRLTESIGITIRKFFEDNFLVSCGIVPFLGNVWTSQN